MDIEEMLKTSTRIKLSLCLNKKHWKRTDSKSLQFNSIHIHMPFKVILHKTSHSVPNFEKHCFSQSSLIHINTWTLEVQGHLCWQIQPRGEKRLRRKITTTTTPTSNSIFKMVNMKYREGLKQGNPREPGLWRNGVNEYDKADKDQVRTPSKQHEHIF